MCFCSWLPELDINGNFVSIIIGFIVCLNPLKPECETCCSILCASISTILCPDIHHRVCPDIHHPVCPDIQKGIALFERLQGVSTLPSEKDSINTLRTGVI